MSDGNSALPTGFRYTLYGQEWDLAADANGKYGYSVGGAVYVFSAGAALNIGDVVYLSAANTVNKSATTGTVLGKVMGVVVGGKLTDMRCVSRKLDVGVAAAASGDAVIVQYTGKCWVVSDAAIVAGVPLIPGTTTAGRALTGSFAAAADVGRVLGNALEAAAAAAATIMVVLGLK